MDKKLYLVSTPIGNYEDITLRALRILKESDIIVCEELKVARRLLAKLDIKDKNLISLNEHNEKETTKDVLDEILSGKKVSLISDCGTPLFSDPGHYLVDLAVSYGIDIIPVPGANSLIPALISSNFDIEKFYYYGWISPKKDIRKREFQKLKHIKELIVLMETPYRLKKILSEVEKYFSPKINVVLAYKLTMPEERIIRGTIKEVRIIAETENLKGEFVLLVDNR